MGTPNQTTIISAIGEISISFANMEFALSSILAQLLDPSMMSLAGELVCDDYGLAQTIRHIRQVARYRYCHDNSMLSHLIDICDRAERIRQIRNLFVHGQWLSDSERLGRDEIVCFERKWRNIRGEQRWSRFKEHVYSTASLSELLARVRQLALDAFALSTRLDPSQMMPMAYQATDGENGLDERDQTEEHPCTSE